MKKIVIIIVSLFLLLSAVNFVGSEPLIHNNSTLDSNNSIDTSIFNEPQEERVLQNINRLDGFFTENRGQVGNESVKYYIQGKGVWFFDDGVVFEIKEDLKVESRESRSRESEELPYTQHHEFEDLNPAPRKSVVLRLNFEGCKKVTPIGRGVLNHRSNFFYGNDSTKWCTNVPNYQEIIYENLYDNIDLRYYSNDKGLKYDFIVHPGGEPSNIKLILNNGNNLYLDANGDLNIQTQLGNIIDTELFIYQNIKNKVEKIEGGFKIIGNNKYGFTINNKYNSDKELIIDPLLYSTFVGGTNPNTGYDIKVDSNDNIYVAGYTESFNFPTTSGVVAETFNGGNVDCFILKLDPTFSSLLYSTYIGGIDADVGFAIELNENDEVYVAGETESNNFPTTPGSFDPSFNGWREGFVLKLNSIGSTLVFCTYIGGNHFEYCRGISVNTDGYIYLTGQTYSDDFQTTPGAYDETKNGLGTQYDVFVLKLNPAGSALVYSTYVGGDLDDIGYDIVIDSNENAYVTGHTYSSNFPITPGAYNSVDTGVFVLKLNPSGSDLSYSTFINTGYGYGIAIDSTGNAYVTGMTDDANFPTTPGAYDTTLNGIYDVFITKMNPTGSGLVYSTFLGGINSEYSKEIEIDPNGNAFVVGHTQSPDFPTANNGYDTTHNGGADVFVVVLDSIGTSLINSTFIGGLLHDYGYGSAIDSNCCVYVTGITYSTDFPSTPNAYDTTNDAHDAFILKIRLNNPPSVLDLSISEQFVYRIISVVLYSNVIDNEDSENWLTPYFEYQDPNRQVWNATNFSVPQYQDSRWETSFTPSKNAVLGFYNFRVRFEDSFSRNSSWFYLNGTLEVLNNYPKVQDLTVSSNVAYRGETTWIWTNGSDIEDPEDELTVELEIKPSSKGDWAWNTTYLGKNHQYETNKWESTCIFPKNAFLDHYDLRARFYDTDGDYGNWDGNWYYSNSSIEIVNVEPELVDWKLSREYVYRTDPVFLYINGTDLETTEEDLKFYAQWKTGNVDWTDLDCSYSDSNNNWQTEFITTESSILGHYDFRVRFVDADEASSSWVYFNNSLEILNNDPMIEDITLLSTSVFRTDPMIIYLNATDIENQEDTLVFNIQYKSPSGDWSNFEDVNYNSDHWEIIFTPSQDAELGSYEVRANVSDLDGGYSGWTVAENTIEVKNNLPEISESCDEFKIGIYSVDIDLTDYGSDIEDRSRDLEWELDETSVDTSLFSASITDNSKKILHLEPEQNVFGSDNITLRLIDKDHGVTLNSNVTIHIDSTALYDVAISKESGLIKIQQGGSKKVILTVKNIGLYTDEYIINFNSDDFSVSSIQFDNNYLCLKPDNDGQITVTINIPKDMPEDYYTITFIARSDNTLNTTQLLLEVLKGETETGSDTQSEEDNVLMSVWIGIVIIIVAIVLFYLFVFGKGFKKKSSPEKKLTPIVQPAPVISQPQVLPQAMPPPPQPQRPPPQFGVHPPQHLIPQKFALMAPIGMPQQRPLQPPPPKVTQPQPAPMPQVEVQEPVVEQSPTEPAPQAPVPKIEDSED